MRQGVFVLFLFCGKKECICKNIVSKDRMEHANKHRWVSIVGNYALSLAKIITCQCNTVSRFLIALLMLMQFMTVKSQQNL